METRRIGGLTVSLVGLGCNNLGGRIGPEATQAVVDAAIDAGITLFDTADIYGGGGASEELLGAAIGDRRDDVVIATKCGMAMPDGSSGAHPDHIARSCDASLRRLGTDRIDLYQLHQPDPSVPILDTIGAFTELVQEGKVLEIGCSNFSPEQITEAAAASADHGLTRFVSVQNELSVLRQRGVDELLAACERHELEVLPYFPLASGLLTGKYRRGAPAPAGSRLADRPPSEKVLDRIEALTSYAESTGHTILELAMSWLARLPRMGSVIAGATTPEQVRANAAAVSWQLTEDERTEIGQLLGS